MKFELSGTYDAEILQLDHNAWSHLPTGQRISMPTGVTISIGPKYTGFSMIDCVAVTNDQPYDEQIEEWSGKLLTPDIVLTERKDMSGNPWLYVNFIGRYLSGYDKCEELRLSRHLSDNFFTYWAGWVHKRYGGFPGEKPDYGSQSGMAYLDEAGLAEWDRLLKHLKEQK